MENPFPAPSELLVLWLLRDGKSRYGLELVKLSRGVLTRGPVYTLLRRMVDRGFITEEPPTRDDHPGMPRPTYRAAKRSKIVLDAAHALGWKGPQ